MRQRTVIILGWVLLAMPACADGTDIPDCNENLDDDTCNVFRIANEARVDAGAEPYAWNGELAVAAQRHARDMVDNGYFSHDSPDGRNFSQRAMDAGYDAFPSGENIAQGQRDADQVMDSWMNSSGHRANILSDSSTEIGVGLVDFTWVQVFGRRDE